MSWEWEQEDLEEHSVLLIHREQLRTGCKLVTSVFINYLLPERNWVEYQILTPSDEDLVWTSEQRITRQDAELITGWSRLTQEEEWDEVNRLMAEEQQAEGRAEDRNRVQDHW